MFEFLTIMLLLFLVGGLVTACLVMSAVWLAWRRLRRHRLVATGRLAVNGVVALTAYRGQLMGNPRSAVRSLRLSNQQHRLRHRVLAAERSGADLGEVSGLLPRLEAEGKRIRTALAQPSPGPEVLAQADRHLAALAEMSAAVDGTMTSSYADEHLLGDVRNATLGLRLRKDAYAELTAETDPTRSRDRSLTEGAA
jgi:hypothetical protein